MEQDIEDELGSGSHSESLVESIMEDMAASGHVGWTYFLVIGACISMLAPPVLILISKSGKTGSDVYFEEEDDEEEEEEEDDDDEDDVWA